MIHVWKCLAPGDGGGIIAGIFFSQRGGWLVYLLVAFARSRDVGIRNSSVFAFFDRCMIGFATGAIGVVTFAGLALTKPSLIVFASSIFAGTTELLSFIAVTLVLLFEDEAMNLDDSDVARFGSTES